MIANDHQKLADFIWSIANKLRGPYRPPQYRKVMLPLIVLRRLDCVLEPTKDKVLEQYAALKKKGLSQAAIEKALAKVASKDRDQPLYNISRFQTCFSGFVNHARLAFSISLSRSDFTGRRSGEEGDWHARLADRGR